MNEYLLVKPITFIPDRWVILLVGKGVRYYAGKFAGDLLSLPTREEVFQHLVIVLPSDILIVYQSKEGSVTKIDSNDTADA
jgi:hypothetical protein